MRDASKDGIFVTAIGAVVVVAAAAGGSAGREHADTKSRRRRTEIRVIKRRGRLQAALKM